MAPAMVVAAVSKAPMSHGSSPWRFTCATSAGQPGWDLAYRTTLRLNGGSGELEVLGAGMEPTDALRTLRDCYRGMGAQVFVAGGESMGWGMVLLGERVIRLLVTPVGEPHECIVFRYEQSRAEFLKSGAPLDGRQLAELPDAPGSRPLLYAADEESGLALEVSSAPASPEEALSFFDSALVSQGWMALVPSDGRIPPPQGSLYRRGGALCAVQAAPDEAGGVRITRMLKKFKAREESGTVGP